MNCCDEYGNCTKGRDCPAQAKPIRRTDPGIEGVFTIARNGIDRVIELERLLADERERKLAYLREWYQKNREHQIAKARAWALAHPERDSEKKREYVQRHPERRAEQQRKWANKPEVKARQRANPNRRAYNQQRNTASRQHLSDEYVRRVMAQHLSITGSQIPQTLVDAHREVMKIKRLINEQRA